MCVIGSFALFIVSVSTIQTAVPCSNRFWIERFGKNVFSEMEQRFVERNNYIIYQFSTIMVWTPKLIAHAEQIAVV